MREIVPAETERANAAHRLGGQLSVAFASALLLSTASSPAAAEDPLGHDTGVGSPDGGAKAVEPPPIAPLTPAPPNSLNPTAPPARGYDPSSAGPARARVAPGPTPERYEAPAVHRERDFSGFGAFFDQDFLFLASPFNEDRNYTMGLAFSLSGRFAEFRFFEWLDNHLWLGKLHKGVYDSIDGHRWHAIVFGNGAFTPDDLNRATPDPHDRSYSSLLYLSFDRSTYSPGCPARFGSFCDVVLRSELTVGMLGLPIGREIQTFIHQSRSDGDVRPYTPLGWDTQVSNGGEPTLRYLFSVQTGGPPYWWLHSRWHDISLYSEASVGYYTNAAIGPVIRAGRIRTHFTSLTANPITAANQMLPVGEPARETESEGPGKPYRKCNDFELYLYATGHARAILYNALLQGQFRDHFDRLSWSEVNHGLLDGEFGASFGGWGASVTLALIAFRTAEYEFPSVAPRTHTWGGIYVTYHLPDK